MKDICGYCEWFKYEKNNIGNCQKKGTQQNDYWSCLWWELHPWFSNPAGKLKDETEKEDI